MSADDWLNCPVCHGLPDKLAHGYNHFYGKIPEEEYLKLKREYEARKNRETVRVDYEYELYPNGIITLNFFAQCNLCGAEWKHKGDVAKS